jgi:histidinol-phosphate aminotransferase
VKDLLRPEIDTLAAYSLKETPCRIKLNQNENPYELPATVKQEIVDLLAAERWSRYPPFVPRAQLDQLAAFTGWRADGILLGNGSNDILQLLFACVLDKGRSVVISKPTFTLYTLLAQAVGAVVHDVPMLPGFRFDTEAIVQAAGRHTASMTVLCSPNNPTGTQLAAAEIERILDGTGGLVVVDEAYVQFAPYSVAGLLERHPRLVVLQTFSKAMGAAGLRFGYGLMAPSIAGRLNRVKLPYAVNTFTLIAAGVLMRRWVEVRGWIGTLNAERERVRAALATMPGITVYPSAANFLLLESQVMPPSQIFEWLCADGILIRDVSGIPLLARALRVSIGTPEENNEFLGSMRRAL